MPNWCYTTLRFHGSKNEIEDLHAKLSECTSKSYQENGFDGSYGCWLGNVLHHVGLGERINAEDKTFIRCRGWIDSFYEIHHNSDESIFDLDMASAWVPNVNMWLEVIKALNYETVKFSYVCEEPLMEIYAMYDPFGDWPYKYIIDVVFGEEDLDNKELTELYDMKYFSTKEDFISAAQKFLETEDTDCDKLKGRLHNYKFKNEHTGITVYEYELLDSPEWS